MTTTIHRFLPMDQAPEAPDTAPPWGSSKLRKVLGDGWATDDARRRTRGRHRKPNPPRERCRSSGAPTFECSQDPPENVPVMVSRAGHV